MSITYLAEIPPESGEVVAMCQYNGVIFIATAKGHIYAYKVSTINGVRLTRVTPE